MRETTFEWVDRLVGVNARVFGPTGSVSLTLIVDTASAMSVIAPRVASLIGYSRVLRIGSTVTRTAAAHEHGYYVRMRIAALGFGVTHNVNVADLGYGVDGLIGINFLSNFNVEMRFAERRIVLELPPVG